jgi:hypothetical protein
VPNCSGVFRPEKRSFSPAKTSPRRPRFGAAKDLLHVRDDFDEPLEDFAAYTA